MNSEVPLAISDSIRARYPHEAPQREAFVSEGDYLDALMRYYKGQAELTEGFFAAIPFAAITTLGDGCIAYANSQAQQLFGLTPADLIRHRANDFLLDADGNPIGAAIGRRVAEGESIRQEAVYVRRPDARREMRLLSVAPVFMPPTRNLARAIGLFQDPGPLERELESLRVMNARLTASIKEKAREAEHNHVLAHTDDLTGLPNMRAFWKELREAVEQERIGRGSIAVFYFDADGFSKKNVAHGHQATDGMIRAVANRLRSVCEAHNGFVARYGGDEFCAFFRSVTGADYLKIADAFVVALNFKYETRKVSTYIGVSIGGTICMNGEISPPQEMVDEADEAMYESKQSGRDEEKTKPHVLRSAPLHSSVPPRP